MVRTMKALVLVCAVAALGCGEITETSPLSPLEECPLLIAYVSDWAVDTEAEGVWLEDFVMLENRTTGSATRSLNHFVAASVIGDTSQHAEIVSFAEFPHLLTIEPGTRLGKLSDEARDVLLELAVMDVVHEPAGTPNIMFLRMSGWQQSVMQREFVSLELELLSDDLVAHLQMRFQPGDETHAVAGDYECAAL